MTGRTLTTADRVAAEAFARALAACGRTHEEIAADVGVSPGMVYQWAKPLRAISLKRAPSVAAAVGVADPSTISAAYATWARAPAPPAPAAAPAPALSPDALRLAQVYDHASPAQRAAFDALARGYEDAGAGKTKP